MNHLKSKVASKANMLNLGVFVLYIVCQTRNRSLKRRFELAYLGRYLNAHG